MNTLKTTIDYAVGDIVVHRHLKKLTGVVAEIWRDKDGTPFEMQLAGDVNEYQAPDLWRKLK